MNADDRNGTGDAGPGAAARALWLVRHAQAAARGPDWPDDRRRPLIAKGRQQAALLVRAFSAQRVRVDRLFSSPFTRAAQTAEPLAELLAEGGRPAYLDALAGGDHAALLTELVDLLGPDDRTVVLVGHEPYLGELASLLLVGDPGRVPLHVRKASATLLTGALRPGGMQLGALLPMRAVKALLRGGRREAGT